MVSNLNQYFNKIYCINLKRHINRWKKVSVMFDKFEVNVERIEAIDGNSIKNNIYNLRPAQYGCLMSHKLAYEDAIKNNYDKILMLEDDIYFDKNINTYDFSKLPEWDILYLGASQYDWNVRMEDGYYYNTVKTQGTFANAFKKHVLIDLVKRMENTNSITIPMDVYLPLFYTNSKYVSITIFPNIIIADVRSTDSVSGGANQIEHSKNMKWNLDNFNIEMETNIHKWDNIFNKLNKNPLFYGKTITYELGNEFLSDCNVVEDWGTGGGGFKSYRQNAIGVDGSNTPFADKKFIDLRNYISECDGIFMRHVLEHNYEWEKILHNVLKSAKKKICLIMFIPFSDAKTKQLAFNSIGVPDLSISKYEFYNILKEYPEFTYRSEELKTDTQYKYEQIIYIEKIQ